MQLCICNFDRLYLARVSNLVRHFTQYWSKWAYEIQEVFCNIMSQKFCFVLFFKVSSPKITFSFRAYAGQWSINYTAVTSTVWPVNTELAIVLFNSGSSDLWSEGL